MNVGTRLKIGDVIYTVARMVLIPEENKKELLFVDDNNELSFKASLPIPEAEKSLISQMMRSMEPVPRIVPELPPVPIIGADLPELPSIEESVQTWRKMQS